MNKLIASLLLLVFSLGSAAAFDGHELSKACRTGIQLLDSEITPQPQRLTEGVKCIAYVRAFDEGHAGTVGGFALKAERVPDADFVTANSIYCKPENVRVEQLVRVVDNFFRNHPELLHQPAGISVMQSFVLAFPCNQ